MSSRTSYKTAQSNQSSSYYTGRSQQSPPQSNYSSFNYNNPFPDYQDNMSKLRSPSDLSSVPNTSTFNSPEGTASKAESVKSTDSIQYECPPKSWAIVAVAARMASHLDRTRATRDMAAGEVFAYVRETEEFGLRVCPTFNIEMGPAGYGLEDQVVYLCHDDRPNLVYNETRKALIVAHHGIKAGEVLNCQCMTNIWVQKQNRLPNFAETRICASFDAEATRHTRYRSNSMLSSGGWEQLMAQENAGRENYNAGGGVLIGEEEAEDMGKNTVYCQYGKQLNIWGGKLKEGAVLNPNQIWIHESEYYGVNGEGYKGDGDENDDQDSSHSPDEVIKGDGRSRDFRYRRVSVSSELFQGDEHRKGGQSQFESWYSRVQGNGDQNGNQKSPYPVYSYVNEHGVRQDIRFKPIPAGVLGDVDGNCNLRGLDYYNPFE